MTPPQGADLGRAPRPIRELGELLATRGTPLGQDAAAPPGERVWYAHTPIGVVRVWQVEGFWSADIALPGVDAFVDADAWAACPQGRRLSRLNRPTPGAAAAFVRGLLEASALPPYEAECLARVVRERDAASAPSRRTTLLVVLGHVILIGVGLWGGVVHDQAVLRVMTGLAVVSLLTFLLRPLVRRRWGG